MGTCNFHSIGAIDLISVCVSLSQDHELLVGQREDLERQLKEESQALEEQKKRYEEMEVLIYV